MLLQCMRMQLPRVADVGAHGEANARPDERAVELADACALAFSVDVTHRAEHCAEHGAHGVPRRLVLRGGRKCAGRVRSGHLLPTRVDGARAVRGGHVEQQDGPGGGLRHGVRSGALLRICRALSAVLR